MALRVRKLFGTFEKWAPVDRLTGGVINGAVDFSIFLK